MLSVFSAVKEKVKVRSDRVVIDGTVCRLHYRVTSLVLLGACLLVTSQQYFGTHIQCILEQAKSNKQFLQMVSSYCFITSTFTIPKYNNATVGRQVAHPGLGPYVYGEDEVVWHAYYQWVPFVLFFQAMLFYVPRMLWKKMEGQKVANVLLGLNTLVLDKDERHQKEITLAKYMVDRLNSHDMWAYCYFACELLNLLNVLLNIYLTDRFLGGEFSTYGPKVLHFLEKDPEDRNDPMNFLFPKVTKCIFHKFGHSGTIERLDALCILALNIVNEKIYVFLWFWFVLLAAITVVSLLWRLLTIFFGYFRRRAIRLLSGAPAHSDLDLIFRHLRIGDWLLLDFLGTNMESLVFGDFLKVMAVSLRDPLFSETKPMLDE